MPDPIELSGAGEGEPLPADRCETCGGEARLGNGVCVRCLLEEGSRVEGELTEEELALELAAADVPDTDWQLGNYQILGELGRGGMGIIYRARQRHSSRIVALKRVLGARAGDPAWLGRFRREVKAAASLDHPNVLPIYEIGEDQHGVPYFSMKLASRGSLRDVAPSLLGQPREAVQLMVKVARAVQHAHERGVLHRDLQPANVLLDDHGEPLVSDFGLARWLDEESNLTQTMSSFGTPGYIAPEQAEGSPADLKPTADVYGLGAILFYLLAGRPPFIGQSALSVVKQAAVADAPKLRSILPTVDRELETIVACCIERDPAARYQSAGDLADDLERWLNEQPINARPVSVAARFRRWSWRNPAFAITAAVCVLLAAGFSWSLTRHSAAEAAPAIGRSIAVLPFKNVAPDESTRFLGDAVQDNVLSTLGKVADLKVISRASVRDYKPDKPRDLGVIAKVLDVNHLLEGSVRRNGDSVHVSARLIDAQTTAPVWSGEYERNIASLPAIESEIVQAVVQHLRINVTRAARAAMTADTPQDFTAYNLFLEASDLIYSSIATRDPAAALKKSVLLLDEAIQRDPKFVRAYCELARANENLYWNDLERTPERLALAKRALDGAVAVCADCGETHLARARYQYTALRDYDAAARELARAHERLPNDPVVLIWQGLVDRRQQRWAAGRRNVERAHELNPRDGETVRALADTLLDMRDYKAAEELLKTSLVTIPNHAPIFFAKLTEAYLGQGAPDKVVALSARVPAHPGTGGFEAYYRFTVAMYQRDFEAASKTIAGPPPIPDSIRGPTSPPIWFQAMIERAQHHDEAAAAAFEATREWIQLNWGNEPDDPMRLSLLARVEAGLGQKEEAIRHGRRAVAMAPPEKDAMDGPTLATALAVVYAWTGERDLALETLTALSKSAAGPSYGDLHLNPRWDSLRDDPRFDNLVGALRPNE